MDLFVSCFYILLRHRIVLIRVIKKACSRLAAASDKVYQLLPMVGGSGTPASSTTKTGRHDIAEILLKVALNTIKIKIEYKAISDTELPLLVLPLHSPNVNPNNPVVIFLLI
jgi:hypothetical protein